VAEFIEAHARMPSDAHIAINGHVTKTGKTRKTAGDEPRLREQPGHPQTHRRNLRLDQNDRRKSESAAVPRLQTVFIFSILAYNLIYPNCWQTPHD
jgi:hypothetical protein